MSFLRVLIGSFYATRCTHRKVCGIGSVAMCVFWLGINEYCKSDQYVHSRVQGQAPRQSVPVLSAKHDELFFPTSRVPVPQPSKALPKRLLAQRGNPGGIDSLALSPNNRWLATGGDDGTIVLWDSKSGKEVLEFNAHSKAILAVAFSHDSKWLATASRDNTCRVWELTTRKEMCCFKGHSKAVTCAAWSNDAKYIITGSVDKTARLWDAKTGEERQRFEGHSEVINSLAVSADNKWLVTGSSDRTAILWDLENGQRKWKLDGHLLSITCVAISRNGRWVATSSYDDTVRLWEVLTGKEVLCLGKPSAVWPAPQGVHGMAFSPDGTFLIIARTGGGGIEMWDARNGRKVRDFKDDLGDGGLLAISEDAKLLVAKRRDNGVRLWAISTGEELQRYQMLTSKVRALALSPDDKFLVTGSDVGALWQMASGKQIAYFRMPNAESSICWASVTGPKQWFVASFGDNNGFELWDAGNAKKVGGALDSLDPPRPVFSLANENSPLFVGHWGGEVLMWDLRSGKNGRSFANVMPIRSLAASHDGKLLATATTKDWTTRLWDIATGKEIWKVTAEKKEYVACMNWSADDKWLVCGGGDSTARLLDVATGKPIQTFGGDGGNISCLTLSQNKELLVTGDTEGTIRIWAVADARELQRMHGHTDRISAVALSSNNKWLFTASLDCTVAVWDTATGKEICRLITFLDGTWAVFDPQGRYDVSGNDVKGLYWIEGLKAFALERFKDGYYDPRLLSKHLGLDKEGPRALKQ